MNFKNFFNKHNHANVQVSNNTIKNNSDNIYVDNSNNTYNAESNIEKSKSINFSYDNLHKIIDFLARVLICLVLIAPILYSIIDFDSFYLYIIELTPLLLFIISTFAMLRLKQKYHLKYNVSTYGYFIFILLCNISVVWIIFHFNFNYVMLLFTVMINFFSLEACVKFTHQHY